MHNWNTVFVEVPLSTFNPIKTVNGIKPIESIGITKYNNAELSTHYIQPRFPIKILKFKHISHFQEKKRESKPKRKPHRKR